LYLVVGSRQLGAALHSSLELQGPVLWLIVQPFELGVVVDAVYLRARDRCHVGKVQCELPPSQRESPATKRSAAQLSS